MIQSLLLPLGSRGSQQHQIGGDSSRSGGDSITSGGSDSSSDSDSSMGSCVPGSMTGSAGLKTAPAQELAPGGVPQMISCAGQLLAPTCAYWPRTLQVPVTCIAVGRRRMVVRAACHQDTLVWHYSWKDPPMQQGRQLHRHRHYPYTSCTGGSKWGTFVKVPMYEWVWVSECGGCCVGGR